MDHFLYEVLKYFHYYLKYQVTSKDEALETQGYVISQIGLLMSCGSIALLVIWHVKS